MPPSTKVRPTLVTFHQQVLQKVVVLVCRRVGFEAIQPLALHALVEILELYLQDLFVHVHSFAEVASRTRPNLNDVALLLTHSRITVNDLVRVAQSTSSKERRRLSVASNGTGAAERVGKEDPESATFFDNRPERLLKVLLTWPDERPPKTPETAPVSQPSQLQTSQGEPLTSSTADTTSTTAEVSKPEDTCIIPRHLPTFPPDHTYKHTPVYPDRSVDSYRLSQIKAEQNRLVEDNLKNLMAKVTQDERRTSKTGAVRSLPVTSSIPLERPVGQPGSALASQAQPQDLEPTPNKDQASATQIGTSFYPTVNYQRIRWKRTRTASTAT
ncbi:hypothetical protein IWQ62_000800 [Dispira parvispora]|uniref:Transcription initiation factor TFIID subunit 8 n=1 Tax=Dispira parvispora TaxID=1520584 RepID=A0A9W8AU16_9FUNG|nr:hypothetical protein IWQ62_000800 [Dispira parvispora]